jgi:cyclopropane fatty-acyl-phospholipid synthase-like methyltransferase
MIKIETQYPIASDSPDHLYPHGTAHDNSTDVNFLDELTAHFKNEKINFLDLGCSGGQLVVDLHNKGNVSIGLEGSDYSLVNNRANWPEYGNKILFTCDITKPFKIFNDEEVTPILFDVITAWEVVEHIKYSDLSLLFQNINNSLKTDGIFLASIAMHPDGPLHQTVNTKEEWLTTIFPEVLKNTNLVVKEYPFQYWVRGGSQSFHIMLQKNK